MKKSKIPFLIAKKTWQTMLSFILWMKVKTSSRDFAQYDSTKADNKHGEKKVPPHPLFSKVDVGGAPDGFRHFTISARRKRKMFSGVVSNVCFILNYCYVYVFHRKLQVYTYNWSVKTQCNERNNNFFLVRYPSLIVYETKKSLKQNFTSPSRILLKATTRETSAAPFLLYP